MEYEKQNAEKFTGEPLAVTVIAMENLEDASAALIDLSKKNKSLSCDLALSILNECKGDVFFQAVAFEVLYYAALPTAVKYIEDNSSKVDVYLLGVMLSSITEDSDLLEENSLIKDAVRYLQQTLLLKNQSDLEKISSIVDWFNSTYY
jgi:hypothetical protein